MKWMLLAALWASPAWAIDPIPPATAAPAPVGSPMAYNDRIVEQQDKVGDKMLTLSAAFEKGDMPSVDLAWQALGAQVADSLAVVRALGPFDSDATLRDAAVALLDFYARTVAGPYKQIIDIYRKAPITESDLAMLDQVVGDVQREEAAHDGAFAEVQKKFATTHHFSLVENDLQQRIDKVGQQP